MAVPASRTEPMVVGDAMLYPSPGPAGPRGEIGPQGPAGLDGRSIEVAGQVDTYDQLPQELGADDAGRGYVVSADGNLYVWSGTAFPPDGGGVDFVGPRGADGEPGPPGVPETPWTDIKLAKGVSGTARVRRIGDRVEAEFRNVTGTATRIGEVPPGFRPNVYVFMANTINNSNVNLSQAQIRDNGFIYAGPRFTPSYQTQDPAWLRSGATSWVTDDDMPDTASIPGVVNVPGSPGTVTYENWVTRTPYVHSSAGNDANNVQRYRVTHDMVSVVGTLTIGSEANLAYNQDLYIDLPHPCAEASSIRGTGSLWLPGESLRFNVTPVVTADQSSRLFFECPLHGDTSLMARLKRGNSGDRWAVPLLAHSSLNDTGTVLDYSITYRFK